MDLKIKVCIAGMIALIAAAGAALKLLKKKLTFREVFTGTLVYVFAKTMLAKILVGIASAICGSAATMLVSGCISAAADAVSVMLCFLLVYRIFYKEESNSIVAVSLGVGAALPEMVMSFGYTLLSYAIILNAVRTGTAETLLEAQGISYESIPAMVEYFSAVSIFSLIVLVLRGIACLISSVMISMAIYYAMEHEKKSYIWIASGIVLAVDLCGYVIGSLSVIAGLVCFLVLFIAAYVYIAGFRPNYVMSVYSEEDQVEKQIRIRGKRFA